MRLVQHGVVDDEHAAAFADQRADFLPQRGGVGLEAVQQPGEGVVGRGAIARGLHRAASVAEQALGVARRNWM